jgi:hypothetical protein
VTGLAKSAWLLLLASVLAAEPAFAKVFLRVSASALPPAKALGVSDVVLLWPLSDLSALRTAGASGYQVFLQASQGELSAASEAAERANAAGVILDGGNQGPEAIPAALARARAEHPKLTYRLLDPGGKEPQMKGRLVVDRDGILQVSSPTSQPWIDSNLALVRLARAFHPESVPLYTFRWDLSEAMRKNLGPAAEDYALAIQEAAAFRADVVLDLHERLQTGLAQDSPEAWQLWNRVKRYLPSEPGGPRKLDPLASTGVVADDYGASYEGINLMARHNLAFIVLRPSDLQAKRLQGLNTLVVFAAPADPQGAVLREFAKKGGMVVLVNLQGRFSWHAAQPVRSDAHSAVYQVGAGQIVELREPVIDPEAFARETRRWIGAERSILGLWNSLTTVAAGYSDKETGETVLELVNYALEPVPVQVRVRGRFSSIRYESPEDGCCRLIPAVERAGAAEFVVPALFIGATVTLGAAPPGAQR